MNATTWNRIRYTLWAPFYDFVALFGRQRRRSIALLALQPGERALLVGAGTGADLPLIPAGVEVLATDLMLYDGQPQSGMPAGEIVTMQQRRQAPRLWYKYRGPAW